MPSPCIPTVRYLTFVRRLSEINPLRHKRKPPRTRLEGLRPTTFSFSDEFNCSLNLSTTTLCARLTVDNYLVDTKAPMTDQCSHEDLRDEIREIKDTLKPIADAFNAVSKLGSWAKSILAFIALLSGAYLAIKGFFK